MGNAVSVDACRDLAIGAMKATHANPLPDFLKRNDIPAPVPRVPGALPAHARVPFFSPFLGEHHPFDLVVLFDIADYVPGKCCSRYYDPTSPWYNVFFGAYGILSHKKDGSCWGYDADGKADYDEFFKVPALDYNYLTAAQLGCPPDKMIFDVKQMSAPDKKGRWDWARMVVTVPSGRHHPPNPLKANALYYTVFGPPHKGVVGNAPSYEPVDLHGEAYFRRVTEAREPITLAWGAAAPDTEPGRALLGELIAALKPLYLP
jgi:hypothetical protein